MRNLVRYDSFIVCGLFGCIQIGWWLYGGGYVSLHPRYAEEIASTVKLYETLGNIYITMPLAAMIIMVR